MSPLKAIQLRAQLKALVRDYFGARDFLEVDTPALVVSPGTEVHLRYFKSAWRDIHGHEHPVYLRSSPELHMKQVLGLGAPRIYQIAPSFRNGGELADWHHPEFTMLEWYQAGLSFQGLIDQTEELLLFTHERLALPALALPKRFVRLTVGEAFERFAGVALVDGDPDLAAKGLAAGAISPRPDDDFETAFFRLLLEKIEPAIAGLGAVVLTDYPASQAALATVRDGVAKRCEFYIGRVELSNGFEEQLDAATNLVRYEESRARRMSLGYEAPPIDSDFIDALAGGIAPCSGNALGFDRWLALLAGETNLNAVVPFRHAWPYRDQLDRD